MTPTFKGPIAGANLLAETKNYPWHRPPEIVDYDEAADYMIERVSQPEQAELIYSLLQIDIKISTIVSSLLMQAISKGKMPIDLAILTAGPLARFIEIVAKTEGYKYDMGTDDKDRIRITPTLMRMSLGILDEEEMPEEPTDEAMPVDNGGLMGAPMGIAPEDEQAAMLGMNIEEETVDGVA